MKGVILSCAVLWLLLAALTGVVVSATRGAAYPRHELLVSSMPDGDRDLFLIDVDRGLQANLTRFEGDDDLPAWSPDGQQVAFYSQRNGRTDLYWMDAEGRGVRRLAESGAAGVIPAWSGDGQWIAYAVIHQPSTGLYIVRPDGTDIHRLTTSPAAMIGWSPDSQHIAFVGNCESNCDLSVVDITHLTVRTLTHNGVIDYYPVWSPDGRQLAFVSNRSLSFEVYVLDIDCDETQPGGCPAHRLTQNRAADTFPAWSPDGRQIAFASDRSGYYEVYRLALDCLRQPQGCYNAAVDLTPDSETNTIMPLWSPDGQQIAYLSADHRTHFDVYVLDVMDGRRRLMLRKMPSNGTLAWRPR